MEDKELLELLRTQPSEGIRQAAALYGGIAKASAARILEDSDTVEECAADAFVKLWRSAARLDPEKGCLKSYIAVLARNAALDVCRKRKARPRALPLEELTIAADVDLETDYTRKINGQLVRSCVQALPEPDRTIFLRRYYFCERVKTIAEALGLDAKRVENILFRGKKKLEEALLKNGLIR